mmetsp:Transcript_4024/g.10184  ORF Transcript_4024/g.10184 Transcript_4024/m.10184 type:complete len:203 (-) Transcript_4024:771-1379(-)
MARKGGRRPHQIPVPLERRHPDVQPAADPDKVPGRAREAAPRLFHLRLRLRGAVVRGCGGGRRVDGRDSGGRAVARGQRGVGARAAGGRGNEPRRGGRAEHRGGAGARRGRRLHRLGPGGCGGLPRRARARAGRGHGGARAGPGPLLHLRRRDQHQQLRRAVDGKDEGLRPLRGLLRHGQRGHSLRHPHGGQRNSKRERPCR